MISSGLTAGDLLLLFRCQSNALRFHWKSLVRVCLNGGIPPRIVQAPKQRLLRASKTYTHMEIYEKIIDSNFLYVSVSGVMSFDKTLIANASLLFPPLTIDKVSLQKL